MPYYENSESQGGGSGSGFKPGHDDWKSLIPSGHAPGFLSVTDLRVGDIILSTSTGAISAGIREISGSRVSHSYTYIGEGQIIEADGDGVVLRTIQEALQDDYYAAAYRIVGGLSSAEQTALIRFLRSKIGAGYDYQGVAAFLVDSVDQDPDRYFCSELVLSAYGAIGRPLGSAVSETEPGALLRLSNIRYLGHLKPSSMADARSQAYMLSVAPGAVKENSPATVAVQAGDLIVVSAGQGTQLALALGNDQYGLQASHGFAVVDRAGLMAYNPQGIYRHQGLTPEQAHDVAALVGGREHKMSSLTEIKNLQVSDTLLYLSMVIIDAFSSVVDLFDETSTPPALVGVEYIGPFGAAASRSPASRSKSMNAQSREAILEDFVKMAVKNGATEEEARAYLNGSAQSLSGGMSSSQGITTVDGWMLDTFLDWLAEHMPKLIFAPLFEYCDRMNHTIAIGPEGSAGLAVGGSVGYGVFFGPGQTFGYYGSFTDVVGWIAGGSLQVQLTVIFGRPELMEGRSRVDALEVAPIAGEAFSAGIALIRSLDGKVIGWSGSVGISIGIPVISEVSITVGDQDTQIGYFSRDRALATPFVASNVTPIRPLSGDTINVRLRCFIPSPAIMVEPFGNWGGLDVMAFKGDGRSFSYDGGTHRGQINAAVNLSSTGGRVASLSGTDWGTSHRYNKSDTYEVAGKPSWWRGVRENAEYIDRIAKLVRNDKNLNLRAIASAFVEGDAFGSFELIVDGGLPLLPSVTPNINAKLFLHLKRQNGQLQAKLVGGHDGFPAYEVYINQQRIHHYDPVAAGNSPMSLMGFSSGDQRVDTGWVTIGTSTGSQSLAMPFAAVEQASCWR